MADIQKQIEAIEKATLGKEVRGSIVEGIKKINDDNEKYQDIKDIVVDAQANVSKQIEDHKSYTEQRLDKFSDDYSKEVKTAADRANTIAQTVETKLAEGELTGSQGATGAIGPTGAQGVQGGKGDKGEKGETGESGFVTAIDTGLFAISVDPDTGDLYVQYNEADKDKIPQFEYDSVTGNLYVLVGEDD